MRSEQGLLAFRIGATQTLFNLFHRENNFDHVKHEVLKKSFRRVCSGPAPGCQCPRGLVLLKHETTMIELTRGNILKAEAEALVNTVNCAGFMGKGIALQFKKAYPDNFNAYHKACNAGEVQPGRMFVFDLHSMLNPKYVVNFPTKRDWRANSRYEDIESGLQTLVAEVRQRGIRSLAMPPLGCGLGGLDWNRVRPMIERAFANLPDVRLLLFAPAGAPAAKTMPVRDVPPPAYSSGLGSARRRGLDSLAMTGLSPKPFCAFFRVFPYIFGFSHRKRLRSNDQRRSARFKKNRAEKPTVGFRFFWRLWQHGRHEDLSLEFCRARNGTFARRLPRGGQGKTPAKRTKWAELE